MITIHSYTNLPDHSRPQIRTPPLLPKSHKATTIPTSGDQQSFPKKRAPRHGALLLHSQLMSAMSAVDAPTGTTPSPSSPPGHRGCCTSGATLELVGAFTAVCLVLYGVILYMNYLYVRWSGRDGVHRTDSGAGLPARKRAPGGIDKAALAAIPVLRFKADVHGGGGESPMECAVCLSAMQDGDAVRALPGCRHAFHVACVDAWLCARATCPVCRARPALPPPQQAPKAGAKVAGASSRLPDLESQV